MQTKQTTLVCAALALLACKSTQYLKPLPPLRPVSDAEIKKSFRFSDKARQAVLQTMVFDVPAGYNYGQFSIGNGCFKTFRLVNTEGVFEMETRRYTDVFDQRMHVHGYPVNTDPVLFKGAEEKTPELKVAARVLEMNLNYCEPAPEDQLRATGTAYMKIAWSVFSNLEKKVVFKATTEGSTYTEVESGVGQTGIIRVAFADAAERLALLDGYRAVVDAQPAAAAETRARFRLKRAPQFAGDLKANLGSIRQSVATVISNRGSGSGFVISADGKLVTAAHVVAGSRFVKVMRSGGKECYGEVVSSDARRDLALVALDCAGLTALPLSSRPLVEGSEVFAVGTPLSEKLEFSVTKGVVSGIRTIDGQTFLQSDVSVLPGSSGGPLLDSAGNVVGVTTSGATIGGAPAGLNFFVPSSEVEKCLPIEFEAAP